MWHWLQDETEGWEGGYTLLFLSLHSDNGQFVTGFWQVWDEGTGLEDPTAFGPLGKGNERGRPNGAKTFSSLAEALNEVARFGVTEAGFADRSDLIASYARARSKRSNRPLGPRFGGFISPCEPHE